MPKLKKPLTPDQRIESRKEIIEQLDGGELKLGQAIRKMRLEWTGLSQGRFGKIVGLSANTVSAVERDGKNAQPDTAEAWEEVNDLFYGGTRPNPMNQRSHFPDRIGSSKSRQHPAGSEYYRAFRKHRKIRSSP